MSHPVWMYWKGECPDWIKACQQTIAEHAPGVRLLNRAAFACLWDRDADIATGAWHPVNFQFVPFHFPHPLRLIVEGCTEAGGRYNYTLLRLPWLAPDITTAIVNGRQPQQLNAKMLMGSASRLPADWAERRTAARILKNFRSSEPGFAHARPH